MSCTATSARPVKNSFTNIYDQPLPDAYFSAMRRLEYRMPHFAQPIFRRAVREISEIRGRTPVRMLDLCSGYGVNGALATHDLEMKDLYELYRRAPAASEQEIERTLARDTAYFAARRLAIPPVRVAGVDVAGHALDYARRTGLVDRTLCLNLEQDAPSAAAKETLGSADLITVTGGLSYIGAETFGKILDLYPHGAQPWIIAFPLRHTDFGTCEETFARFGLQVSSWPHRGFPHRRFEDEAEQRRVLEAIDVDGDALSSPPSPTHLEAVLYFAAPKAEAEMVAVRDLLHPRVEPARLRVGGHGFKGRNQGPRPIPAMRDILIE